MATKVSATKTVSFKMPYTGKTFQGLTQNIFGTDGYLSGGATSDDGSTITVDPFTIVQRGIAATSLAATTGIVVPTAPQPWFLLAAVPDDNPDSGILLSVTADVGEAAAGLVIAFKNAGHWQSPVGVDIANAARRNNEQGLEAFWQARKRVDVTGNLLAVDVFKGTVVDADGERRAVPYDTSTSNGAIAGTGAQAAAHQTRYRTDHVVLRQPEGHTAHLATLMGGTVKNAAIAPTTIDTVAATVRAGHYSRRGLGAAYSWFAWKNGTALKVQGGQAAEGFAAVTLLTATSAIMETWIAGHRASDLALMLLYVEGSVLKLVSFNPTTGAQINAPVTIANTGVQISHVRAVMDANETIHVAFESADATHQVYYMTCSSATAAFGVVGVSARHAHGSVTATNDTWPSIGVDRKGIATIAWIAGTAAPNEYGDLMVATWKNGALVTVKDLAASSDVGIDGKVFAATELDTSGDGVQQVALSNFRRPSVVVTPYDEAYVACIGMKAADTVPQWILLYNDGFKAAHGVELVNLAPKITTATMSYSGLSACGGDAGEILIAAKIHDSVSNETDIAWLTLNPRPMDSGRIGSPTLVRLAWDTADTQTPETSGFDDILLTRGPNGGFQLNYVFATNVKTADLYTLVGETLRAHPRDIYIGSWVVPPAAGGAIQTHDHAFHLFNTSPKRMNHPILVGDGGTYQGYASLNQAAREASRTFGEIILRPGTHSLGAQLQLFGRLRGEGRSTIIVPSGITSAILLGIVSAGAVTISGSVVSSTDTTWQQVAPGSVIQMATSGYHTVLRNLGYDSFSSKYQLLVEDNASGAPVGATATLFSGGIELENLTIIDEDAVAFRSGIIFAQNCYKPAMRHLRVEGRGSVVLSNCISPFVDGLDLTGSKNLAAEDVLELDNGDGAVIRDVKVKDGVGRVHIANTCQNPHLVHCHTTLPSSNTAYLVDGARTTEALFTSCTGKISGNGTTPLNPRTLIDNTNGDQTRHLIEYVANAAQDAPLAKHLGRWSTLGYQSVVDSAGEFSHAGDYLFDDFYRFDAEFWRVTLIGLGEYQTINPNFSSMALGSHAYHSVKLLMGTIDGTDSSAMLQSQSVFSWSDVPFVRMRASIRNTTDVNLYHMVGLFPDSVITNGHAFFLSDPGNLYGFGASSQIRFVVSTGAAYASVLTGVTPTASSLWYWIGWKSATEAWWGISNDLTGAMVASGSLAAGGNINTNPAAITAFTGSLSPNLIAGPVDNSVWVDAVEYRSSSRHLG